MSLRIDYSFSNICPRCESFMRDLRVLMMGDMWECVKCDRRYWMAKEL
jgi:hypothetical protein